MSAPRVACPPVRATYRLQFSRDFTFRDAAALTPYLDALGVSHVYASPITEARPGSPHGYDIINHNRLNPEIGGEEDFRALVVALHARGMGLIVDFVPNHVGIGPDNAWWLDVLEWGKASPFAAYFDINWRPIRPDLKGRVLLPVLSDQYGVVLENGDIALRFDPEEGSFSAWLRDYRLPISPRSYATILIAGGDPLAELVRDFRGIETLRAAPAREKSAALKRRLAEAARDPAVAGAIAAALGGFTGRSGAPASFGPLHRLLKAQAYRIADWRVAAEEINYRRFFDVNDLAGLRMELQPLFEHAHRLVFDLIGRGDVQGLRIDHIDGLHDPRAYCERLQRQSPAPLYVVVEKILAAHEVLPSWPIAGATGYDFANQVLAIFIDPAGEAPMSRLYRRFSGRDETFDAVLYACKKHIMRINLASEVNVLAREFHLLSMRRRRTRDFTLNGMLAALEEVIAGFPVYRTYVSQQGVGDDDRRYIDWALAQAKKRWVGADLRVFDFIHEVLTGGAGETLRVAMHFQQLTGPVMAKAAEETAFYRWVRLLALNEVGGDPRRFGMSVAAFHRLTRDRARHWPRAMVTTATHDTKRGEDARARLALLSEMPREWRRGLSRWTRLNRSRRVEVDGEAAPSRNVEYLFYQALLGAWPPDLEPGDREGMGRLRDRIEAYMLKAAHEAKEATSWINPNEAYDAALRRFVRAALNASRANPFLAEFHQFVEALARPGALASLSQLVLKLTVPGTPDIYQGCELWDFSLVDPDNRRPVDWSRRRALLDEVADASPAALAERWRDGREKLFATQRLLALRRADPDLFAEGDYQPLETAGRKSGHLCAFARRRGERSLVVVAPRLLRRLCLDGMPIDWGSTQIVLPPTQAGWRELFTGRRLEPTERVAAAEILADFPVAVLVSGEPQHQRRNGL